MFLKKINIFLLISLYLVLGDGFAQEKFKQSGIATYYADAFHGRRTSSGEIFNNTLYTAAHATLPFQMLVKVTNLKNDKYVIVKINDRCPKYYQRIIDLSKAAALQLDMLAAGLANVTLEEITPSDLNIISQEAEADTFIIIKDLYMERSIMKNSQIPKPVKVIKTEEECLINTHHSNLPEKEFMLKPKEMRNFLSTEAKFQRLVSSLE